MLNRILSLKYGLKSRLAPLWWYSLMMFVFTRFGDLVNVYIGIFLVPDIVTQDRLGAILPLTRLAALVGLPLAIVLSTALKYINIFEVAGEQGKVKTLLRDLVVLTVVISSIVVGVLWRNRDLVEERLKFEGSAIIWLVAALALVRCWTPVVHMAVQGVQKFSSLILSRVVGPVFRLVAIYLLLKPFQLAGYLGASLAASLSVLFFLGWTLRPYFSRAIKRTSYRADLPAMVRYMIPVGLATTLLTIQDSLEPWIIRQRLSEMDSAGFYMAAMIGNISRYITSAALPFIFILTSDRHERGESTRDMLLQSLGGVLAVGTLITIALIPLGAPILQLRESWAIYSSYAPFIWQISLVTTLTVVQQTFLLHQNACRRFRYLVYYLPLLLGEILMLYGLMGWPFFKPWLPDGLWETVNGFIVRDLQFIVSFMIGARILTTICIAVDMLYQYRQRKMSA